jgi:predicted outer membrane lipoprotein
LGIDPRQHYDSGVAAEPGTDSSRLEAFSDAVFAFALTLLVVSLEVPRTYHELMMLVRGFLPFACSFALLVWIWYEHSAFFSRYRMRDGVTIVLNAALLFVVLFYVYPLKYVMNLAFHGLLPELRIEPPAGRLEASRLFVVYGLGYMAVFVILAALYFRASRWRERELTALDVFNARAYGGAHLVSAGVGLLSVAWAVVAPGDSVTLAGLIYFLMAPAQTGYGMWTGVRRRRAFAR